MTDNYGPAPRYVSTLPGSAAVAEAQPAGDSASPEPAPAVAGVGPPDPAVEPVAGEPVAATVTVISPAASTNGGTPPPVTPPQGGASLLGVAPEPPVGNVEPQHRPLQRSPDNRGFVPTLLSTAVFFVSFAVAVALILYSIGGSDAGTAAAVTAATPARFDLWLWWNEWRYIAAPVVAALVALLGGVLFALFNRAFAQPDRLDPQLYGEIRARLGSLDALLPVLCPPSGPPVCDHVPPATCVASCNEAWARRDFINDELESRGSRWVLGSGYVDLYRQLHAAEEALFIVEPASDVVANALYDDLRLNGADAAIPNAASLRSHLHDALPLLGGHGVQFLSTTNGTVEQPTAAPTESAADDRAVGRMVLRDVRRAISEFRDGERANLVRARNQLIWTGTITAIAGYALLVLAMLAEAPWEGIFSGVVYYVVGAGIGLFSQLRIDRDRESGEEDFGFSRARLFYMPVLSGLAAVGGVLVVALLYEAINFRPDEPQRSLEDIFNVRVFSLGLVLAAVFGLTPGLLVERLEAKADDYRKALKLTSAASGGSLPSP